MHNSTLYPPNHEDLHDTPISQVLQRRSPHDLSCGFSYVTCKFFDDTARTIVAPTQNPLPIESIESTSRFECLLGVNTRQSAGFTGEQADTKAGIEVRLLRQRSRMHQTWYRRIQRTKIADLQANIRSLQEGIQELMVEKRVLYAAPSTNNSVWSVAMEYFRLFRNGFQPPVTTLQPLVRPVLGGYTHVSTDGDRCATRLPPQNNGFGCGWRHRIRCGFPAGGLETTLVDIRGYRHRVVEIGKGL